jgi:hypothetical protein
MTGSIILYGSIEFQSPAVLLGDGEGREHRVGLRNARADAADDQQADRGSRAGSRHPPVHPDRAPARAHRSGAERLRLRRRHLRAGSGDARRGPRALGRPPCAPACRCERRGAQAADPDRAGAGARRGAPRQARLPRRARPTSCSPTSRSRAWMSCSPTRRSSSGSRVKAFNHKLGESPWACSERPSSWIGSGPPTAISPRSCRTPRCCCQPPTRRCATRSTRGSSASASTRTSSRRSTTARCSRRSPRRGTGCSSPRRSSNAHQRADRGPLVGMAPGVVEPLYAVTVERRITHPGVTAIADSARSVFDRARAFLIAAHEKGRKNRRLPGWGGPSFKDGHPRDADQTPHPARNRSMKRFTSPQIPDPVPVEVARGRSGSRTRR